MVLLNLMDKNKLYLIFLKWKAKPINPADPQGIDEFCKKYKTDKKQILEFIQTETYYDDLLTETLNWGKAQTPELLHTVYANIKLSKSVTDLARFLEVVHDIKKKDDILKTQNNFNFFNTIENDQYSNIIRREAKLLKASSKE